MSEHEKGLVEISENFNSSEIIKDSLNKMTKQHRKVGKISTPKGLVKKRQGFDYVELSYMKSIANEQFPGWSWTIINSEALGGAAYVVHGRLKWFDNGVWREGDMVAAHRIQTKKGGTANDFVDIGNDVKAANTDTMKKAFNVYMDIAADVYRSEDPALDDSQIERLLSLGKKAKIEDMQDKIQNKNINSSNYKASVAKLERITK
tara:strand:+ start:830 stop:1444 length:615 start_codon:yes stop_codon:yes gene_type:complete